MLAMVGKNHPTRVKKHGANDAVDDRETPGDVFDPLHLEFRFTLDVAAARHNAKCRRYYALGPSVANDNARQLSLFPVEYVGDPEALALNGLEQHWAKGEVIFCNPPFSDIEPWVQKATYSPATVVMLLPANRCEQPFWQRFIEPCRDGRVPSYGVSTRFLDGRRCFKNRGQDIKNRTSKNPPFGICLVIWDRRTSA